jgi:hypothetical protein
MVWILLYSNIENLVLPPGCKPYGLEAKPVEDPAVGGSEMIGSAIDKICC